MLRDACWNTTKIKSSEAAGPCEDVLMDLGHESVATTWDGIYATTQLSVILWQTGPRS